MIPSSDKLSDYLHYFFTCYLPKHRNVSHHTLAGYKQTFIQLLRYWNLRSPDQPNPGLDQFQVAFLLEFLSHLEKELKNTASTRNTRLAAVKSFLALQQNLWVKRHGKRPDGNAASMEIRKEHGFPPPLGKAAPASGATFPHFHRLYEDLYG